MILVSTHAKLVQKGADIYRVDVPECQVMGTIVPASHEHFATLQQAEKFAANAWGLTCSITKVKASAYNAWTDR